MLRFVQSVHKAFRSTHSRAPCGQLSKDNEDAHSTETQGQRPFCSSTLSVNKHGFEENKESGPGSHSTRDSRNIPGLVEGAFVGAGFTFFKTIHGICSGKDRDRQAYCPVRAANRLTENVREALATRSHHFEVLPNKNRESQRKLNSINKREREAHAVQSDIDLRHKKKISDGVLSLKSVDKENIIVDHLMGLQAWKDQDYSLAASLWQKTLSKMSSPVAAHRLGMCYEHGLGVAVDLQKAANFYRKAAEQGCEQAMFKLAMLHLNGKIEDESVKPLQLAKKAADKGLIEAQTYMGTYQFHKGNKRIAVKYFERAAANDDAEACYYLGVCYETGAGLACSNDSKAAHYYERGANLGHPDAQYNLAVFLEEGYGGLERDYALSLVWYRRAETQGNLAARSRLIEMGCSNLSLSPSRSMPSLKTLMTRMYKHLQMDATDTCMQMPRSRSESMLGSISQNNDNSMLSNEEDWELSSQELSSDSSSMEGRPKFFVSNPTSMVDEDSLEWSSSSSLDSPSTRVVLCSDNSSETFPNSNNFATARSPHPTTLPSHPLTTCSTSSLTRSDTVNSFNVLFV